MRGFEKISGITSRRKSNHRVAHYHGVENWESQEKRKTLEIPRDIVVAVGGPSQFDGRSPTPPQNCVRAEKEHQQIRSDAFRIEQNFVEEDGSEATLEGVGHKSAVGT